jgi:hypothetical protein
MAQELLEVVITLEAMAVAAVHLEHSVTMALDPVLEEVPIVHLLEAAAGLHR